MLRNALVIALVAASANAWATPLSDQASEYTDRVQIVDAGVFAVEAPLALLAPMDGLRADQWGGCAAYFAARADLGSGTNVLPEMHAARVDFATALVALQAGEDAARRERRVNAFGNIGRAFTDRFPADVVIEVVLADELDHQAADGRVTLAMPEQVDAVRCEHVRGLPEASQALAFYDGWMVEHGRAATDYAVVMTIDLPIDDSGDTEEDAGDAGDTQQTPFGEQANGGCDLFLIDAEGAPLPPDPMDLLRLVIQWGIGVARDGSPGAVPIHLPPEYCPAFEAYID